MPRSRSSGSRSVSLPVSARTSQVLPWSMCPAVPTVSATQNRPSNSLLLASCRPETALRRPFNRPSNSLLLGTSGADRGGGLVRLGVRERAAVQQQAAVADDADDRRVAGAQRLGERLLDRAGTARQLGQRQRAAADSPNRLLDLSADRGCQPLGPRAD